MTLKPLSLILFITFLASCGQDTPSPASLNEQPTDIKEDTTVAEFEFAAAEDLVDSRDGQMYKTLQIGEQVWMAENLRFDAGEGSYCYDDNEENCVEFGRLYTWKTAMGDTEEEGSQGVCPEGWHIPSNADWDKLIETVGGETAGALFKEDGQLGFNGNLTGGRMALPDGGHKYIKEGTDVCFWSSESDSTGAFDRNLNNQDDNISKRRYPKDYGFCVRCIKD